MTKRTRRNHTPQDEVGGRFTIPATKVERESGAPAPARRALAGSHSQNQFPNAASQNDQTDMEKREFSARSERRDLVPANWQLQDARTTVPVAL
jgi:hypothetical protein